MSCAPCWRSLHLSRVVSIEWPQLLCPAYSGCPCDAAHNQEQQPDGPSRLLSIFSVHCSTGEQQAMCDERWLIRKQAQAERQGVAGSTIVAVACSAKALVLQLEEIDGKCAVSITSFANADYALALQQQAEELGGMHMESNSDPSLVGSAKALVQQHKEFLATTWSPTQAVVAFATLSPPSCSISR